MDKKRPTEMRMIRTIPTAFETREEDDGQLRISGYFAAGRARVSPPAPLPRPWAATCGP